MKNKKIASLNIFLLLFICGCTFQVNSTTQNDESSFVNSEFSNEESSSTIESDVIEMEKQYVTKKYSNPIFTSSELADPSIIYCEEDNCYYILSTGGKVLKSKNMVYWYPRNNAFSPLPSWGTPGAGLWAPDIQYIKGQYVMYYSLSTWGDSNPGIGVATAPHPEGPWTDKGKLFTSNEISVNNSIDPMVYVDFDNKVYMVWGSMRGNYMVELSEDGLSLKNGINYANQNKIRVAGKETHYQWDVNTYEGAYIIYENGYYYLFLSMGTCCEGLNSSYKVVVGRSRQITGPYLDHNLKDMKTPNAGKVVLDKGDYFVGSGHNSIIKDQNGDYFIYYHTYSLDEIAYRVLAMDYMYFDEEGWPCVKDNKASQGQQEKGPTTFSYIEKIIKEVQNEKN